MSDQCRPRAQFDAEAGTTAVTGIAALIARVTALSCGT